MVQLNLTGGISGWVREGDEGHDGCAIVLCNGEEGYVPQSAIGRISANRGKFVVPSVWRSALSTRARFGRTFLDGTNKMSLSARMDGRSSAAQHARSASGPRRMLVGGTSLVRSLRRRRAGASEMCAGDMEIPVDTLECTNKQSIDSLHVEAAYARLIVSANVASLSAATSIMRPPVSRPNDSLSRGAACVKL
jgi:hypothetical protein